MSRRREMVAMEHLPYLRRVEYLEGCYAPAINTGVLFDNSILSYKHDIEAIFIDVGSTRSVFGCGTSSDTNYGGSLYNKQFYCGTSRGLIGISTSGSVKQRLILEIDCVNHEISRLFDGNSAATNWSGSIANYSYLHIFSQVNGTAISYPCWLRLYSDKIWINNTLVRNFIPVVALFNGVEEGCLYDRVSKQLFRNAGTGAFTWGELT